MSKKNWERKGHGSCKSCNQKCQIGACSIYPYQRQKKTEVKEEEIMNDTG